MNHQSLSSIIWSVADTANAQAERAIALLKERRATVITAAVTGQIDVRGLVRASESTMAEEALPA